MEQQIELSVDSAFRLLEATIIQALTDTKYGTPSERTEAASFLDWICPQWRHTPTRRYLTKPAARSQRTAPTAPNGR